MPTPITHLCFAFALLYAKSVWNRHRQGLIKDLEKVQMRTTKLVMIVKHLS